MSDTEDKLALLKEEADTLGLEYHHKVGVDKLEKLVATAKESLKNPPSKEQSINEIVKDLKQEIRIMCSCNDPTMKDHTGQWITVGNDYISSFTKYISFDNEAGWHMPKIMVNMMKDMYCYKYVEKKGSGGVTSSVPVKIKKYTIMELPPLTKKELKELAEDQTARQAIQQ